MDDSRQIDEQGIALAFLRQFLADRAAGEVGSLATYHARYVGFEDVISREWQRLHGDPAAAAPASRLPAVPERYEILEPIAQGGMATVYRAWDRQLRRSLAMKVYGREPDRETGTAGSSLLSVSRFLEEAQVTSQLDHPGIVPVHDIGMTGDGRAFFTMALVRGRSFKEVIALVRNGDVEWTLPRALGVLAKVCEAVAFAHSKGVLHRDLKPANIMVGRFGAVLVVDWGLARVGAAERRSRPDDASSQSAVRTSRREEANADPDSPLITMAGDVVGTPAYMAPEQARGDVDQVGPWSDVYGIGAILYHLLSGTCPHLRSGESASPRTILARVLDGPPRPLREACTVPPELEAICERAMARDRESRYPDAQALAEDLRAFLELRVVGAYETGAWAELRKWVRRNRALALASASGVLVLAAGLLASVYLGRQAADAAERATTAAARAEANLELADGAIDRMLVRLGDRGLADVPGMDDVRSGLLDDALQLRRALLAARHADPGLRLQTANTHVRLGKLVAMLGDRPAARAEYGAAMAIHDQLVEEQPAAGRPRAELGWDHVLLGMLLADGGDAAAAATEYERAVVLLDEAIARNADPEYRFRKANALNNLGSLHQRQGRLADALPCLQGAVVESRAALAVRDDLVHRVGFAQQLCNLGLVLRKLEREEQGLQSLREGIGVYERLFEQQPRSREVRFGLAVASMQLPVERPASTRAIELLRALTREFPQVADYHGNLGGALHNLALVLKSDGDAEAALARLHEAIASQRIALARVPEHPVFNGYLENHYLSLAGLLGAAGRHREMAQHAEALLAGEVAHAREPYFAALLWSWCCRALERDTSLPAPDREQAQARCRAQAVAALQRAVAMGFRRKKALEQTAFAPLRGDEAFQQLQRELDG